MSIQLPVKMQSFYRPRRYKVRRGGRGGAKSWNIARILVMLSLDPKPLFPDRDRLRILCARELQNSIRESVHQLLRDQIEALGLSAYFNITDTSITSVNGSNFIFSGIKNNVTKVKSMEGIDICWVEEAEKVSENSWLVLIPTIRREGSEIWVSFNPDEETDPTSQRFIVNAAALGNDLDSEVMNLEDNPWPTEALLKERDYLYKVDPDAARHVWGGEFRKRSKAEIFGGKWTVEAFEPVLPSMDEHNYWQGPYFGADWGFGTDPTVLVKCWIFRRRLYIEYCSYHYELELDDTGSVWKKEVPGCERGKIRADNSRPESISYVRRNAALDVVGAKKWDGSVEDGIKWLRSFEQIIIHPRCKDMEDEAKFYKYKVDPITGDVLSVIIDKFNHGWDSVRYAFEPAIRGKRSMAEVL